MTKQDNAHAVQNARGHAENILELYSAYQALEDGAETVKVEGETFTDPDDIRDRATEQALSVEVRSDWHPPGADLESASMSEYRVLLSTGGPALQLTGDLDQWCEPQNALLQYQDWFTPWCDYEPEDLEDLDDALLWFAGCFYFGE